ncbi:MAG: hypothetical protein ACLGHP_02885 [Vicinamibacteria bacterium]
MRGIDPSDVLSSLPPGRAVLVRDVTGAACRRWQAAAAQCGWVWIDADDAPA